MVMDIFRSLRFIVSAKAGLRSPIPPSNRHWLWGNALLLEERATTLPQLPAHSLWGGFNVNEGGAGPSWLKEKGGALYQH